MHTTNRFRIPTKRGCLEAAMALWILLLTGCAHQAAAPGGVTAGLAGKCETPAGQRQIAVKADGQWVELGFQAEGEDGEVRINHHTIRIEPRHLILNGRTVAAVPPAARDFEVMLLNGTLTVAADGQMVFQRPIR